MVTRKPVLPYPTSPPPPPPDVGIPRPNNDVGSDERSPMSATARGVTEDSPYHDMGNPWQDATTTTTSNVHIQQTPLTVQPDPGVGSSGVETKDDQLPDILKPGWSGENTPRSSLDSDRSRDFWESSDDEDQKLGDKSSKKLVNKSDNLARNGEDKIPSILQVKRKPVSPKAALEGDLKERDNAFASNNPFRTHRTQPSGEFLSTWTHVEGTDGLSKGKVGTSSQGSLVSPGTGLPNSLTNVGDASTSRPAIILHDSASTVLPPVPQGQPPLVPVTIPSAETVPKLPRSPPSDQPPLIAVEMEPKDMANPWRATTQAPSERQSPLPEQKAIYTDELLDRGATGGTKRGSLSLGDELKALPNHGPYSTSQTSLSLLDDTPIVASSQKDTAKDVEPMITTSESPSAQPRAKSLRQDLPPIKPLTDVEIAEMNMQRNETYQVKHFRWFDHKTRKLRSSSMLTQNKNGPCPLLALVNALILGAHDRDQAALDEFLRVREQVTLGTIIENLMMELLAAAEDGELPDVDELNRFLLRLRTGMNMNPRFVPPAPPAPNLMDARNSILHLPDMQEPQDKPGTFEPSSDNRMYGAFGIQTVHGWLPEPGSDAASAFKRTAQNYEDAQAKLFGEDELEYKLARNGLSPEEQVIWEDIVSMKHYFQSSPTQLTQYGISCIKASMRPGSFSILFRNDHFSTIYKHPQNGQIYSLITDAGYADRDEVIWESLVDVSGHGTEFYSGDFNSVSHSRNQPTDERSSRPESQGNQYTTSEDHQTPLSPSQRQEQEDADLAMAMQLQEEEEQNDRQRRAQENSTSPRQPIRQPGRRSTGNIPIPIRSSGGNVSAPGQEIRSLVPPRGSRPNVQGVNRPANATDADAPPAYEEAARGKAYHPPLGSPLHPSSSADGGNGLASTSSINLNEAGGNGNRPGSTYNRRRSSAYTENSTRYGHGSGNVTGDTPSPAYDFTDGSMPGSYIHTGRGGHGQSANMGSGLHCNTGISAHGQRQRDRDRDCVVM